MSDIDWVLSGKGRSADVSSTLSIPHPKSHPPPPGGSRNLQATRGGWGWEPSSAAGGRAAAPCGSGSELAGTALVQLGANNIVLPPWFVLSLVLPFGGLSDWLLSILAVTAWLEPDTPLSWGGVQWHCPDRVTAGSPRRVRSEYRRVAGSISNVGSRPGDFMPVPAPALSTSRPRR